MGKLIRLLAPAVLAATTMLLVAACGGDTATSGFQELLEVIPDTAETRGYVLLNDYQRFRETFDIQLPGPEAGDEDLMDYLLRPLDMPLWVTGPFISGYGPTSLQALDRRRYLGFDIQDVLRSAEAGLPPGVLEVIQGDFDPGLTARALTACTECETPEEDERNGIKFYSWGEDLAVDVKKRFAPPAFDQLGRGGRIAVLDGYVFRTVESPGMRRLIDTSVGRGDSLADVEDFRLLAAGLDELNAYSGILTGQTQSFDEALTVLLADSAFTQEDVARLRARMEEELLLLPYDAFATGAGRDDRGQYMAVVLVHSSEGAAEENVELLRRRIEEAQSLWIGRPWSDFIEEMDIRSDGVVLLGKLWGERTVNLWLQFIFNRDPLLLHE
ncbi:MAG: hypothetical protein IIC97_03095 [Chloroflexi bacterium]|nr:hypothetical protein [Chloroflexota bacterium]